MNKPIIDLEDIKRTKLNPDAYVVSEVLKDTMPVLTKQNEIIIDLRKKLAKTKLKPKLELSHSEMVNVEPDTKKRENLDDIHLTPPTRVNRSTPHSHKKRDSIKSDEILQLQQQNEMYLQMIRRLQEGFKQFGEQRELADSESTATTAQLKKQLAHFKDTNTALRSTISEYNNQAVEKNEQIMKLKKEIRSLKQQFGIEIPQEDSDSEYNLSEYSESQDEGELLESD